MPKSFICSFQEKGKLVSSLVRESVLGAFPAIIASTIGGAGRVSLRKRRTRDMFTFSEEAFYRLKKLTDGGIFH